MSYRAASIIYFHFNKVFLGLEDKGWKHFGGKIEDEDKNDPFQTAKRELEEETEGQLTMYQEPLIRFYNEPAKMMCFVVHCSKGLYKRLNKLRPTSVKKEYKWFNVESEEFLNLVPEYVRKQVLEAYQLYH